MSTAIRPGCRHCDSHPLCARDQGFLFVFWQRGLPLPARGLGLGDAKVGECWDFRGCALRPLTGALIGPALRLFRFRQQLTRPDLRAQTYLGRALNQLAVFRMLRVRDQDPSIGARRRREAVGRAGPVRTVPRRPRDE
jgi:hypothetical protein